MYEQFVKAGKELEAALMKAHIEKKAARIKAVLSQPNHPLNLVYSGYKLEDLEEKKVEKSKPKPKAAKEVKDDKKQEGQ